MQAVGGIGHRVAATRPKSTPRSTAGRCSGRVGRSNVGKVPPRGFARGRVTDAYYLVPALLLGVLLLLGEMSEPTEPISLPRRLTLEASTALILTAVWLLVRRRWPVKLALVLVTVGFVSSIGIAFTAFALLNLALHRPPRITLAVAGLDAAVIASMFSTIGLTRREYIESVVLVLLIHTVLVVSGWLVRSQRRLVESLRERARQAEEQQRLRVEEARLLERERLAREMHDVLAHRISLLAVHAGALEYRRSTTPEELRQAVSVIRRNAYEAMEDLRQVIGVLRERDDGNDHEEDRRPQPTIDDLPGLVEQARSAGGEIELELSLDDAAMVPERVGRHLYRIVQEGLTNTRKHAPADPVRVTVRGVAETGLTVEIINTPDAGDRPPARSPGDAHALLPGGGVGLVGLRERVELLGGGLEHGATQEGGFVLRASLPWPT